MKTISSNIYFIGIRDMVYRVMQEGRKDFMGALFFPACFYPFVKIPLSTFKFRAVELETIFPSWTSILRNKLVDDQDVSTRLNILEEALAQLVDPALAAPRSVYDVVRTIYAEHFQTKFETYCRQHRLHMRTLERHFTKFVGTSPKKFQRISRFQTLMARIFKHEFRDFTSLIYKHNYFDQAHFIKDFQAFTGYAPKLLTKDIMDKKYPCISMDLFRILASVEDMALTYPDLQSCQPDRKGGNLP